MKRVIASLVSIWAIGWIVSSRASLVFGATIDLNSPMSPPAWALLQRELIQANTDACIAFYDKYFDERGYLECVERWGGDDGPDDAIENVNDWPILHAIGAPDEILELYKMAWEGHLRQYTEARTVEVPFARDGMYYKEFPVMMDWLHNGEGLSVFNLQGLSDPRDSTFRKRVRRYAGFYLNEDPGAPNYDSEHKLIRSLFNGSRGPLLRKATALDWAGDPIEVENRFELGHGERNYAEMLAHFEDYNDIVGDHPSNLLATSLALNAYMLDREPKYKDWLLEYVDAWLGRIEANDGILPTNIGLDGSIGGATDGKWYGGVYGWSFSVTVPQTGEVAHRQTHQLGFFGFANAFFLTGDVRYLDVWRQQFDRVNANGKRINGRMMYPQKFGDEGWYHFTANPWTPYALELYYLSMDSRDLKWTAGNAWLRYLEGGNPDYPEAALRADLDRVRQRAEGFRADTTTPDTRLADDPMKYNPASVRALVQLMLGGIHPGHVGSILHCRVRYFDPVTRRAGIPKDVAALVDRLSASQVSLNLVNVNSLEARELIVRAGAYGEHRFIAATCENAGDSIGTDRIPMNASHFTVRLAPGTGAKLTLDMERYVNQPSLGFPWD